MIAEIKNKLPDFENKEDKLTGDFFGCMRYMPYTHGLKPILDKYAKSDAGNDFASILHGIESDSFEFTFWKKEYPHGEIDAYMEIGNVAIGIEVKLNSSLGDHQLLRESRMICEWTKGRDMKKLLLFVAKRNDTSSAYKEDQEKIHRLGVHLGHICWEDILLGLEYEYSSSSDVYEKRIFRDLTELLMHKGISNFNGFALDTDYMIDKEKYYDIG